MIKIICAEKCPHSRNGYCGLALVECERKERAEKRRLDMLAECNFKDNELFNGDENGKN